MVIDLLVAQCEFKGELHYQSKIPREERFENIKGYCCLDATTCPYVREIKKTQYCTHE